jgi:predicted AAA+ superfamily ATPase
MLDSRMVWIICLNCTDLSSLPKIMAMLEDTPADIIILKDPREFDYRSLHCNL